MCNLGPEKEREGKNAAACTSERSRKYPRGLLLYQRASVFSSLSASAMAHAHTNARALTHVIALANPSDNHSSFKVEKISSACVLIGNWEKHRIIL